MFALDTETTGIDFHHGARPFFVTLCYEDGSQLWWEWDVDPITRLVRPPRSDLADIRRHLTGPRVLQNGKFDVAALRTIDPQLAADWDWEATSDTLVAGHLLASNMPHDLTSMALQYLGIDIEPYEFKLQAAVTEARHVVRKQFPSWKLANPGVAGMPSVKGNSKSRTKEMDKPWKFDCWLPRALLKAGYAGPESWGTVLSDYANADSAVTIALWKVQQQLLERRKLDKIFQEQMKLPRVLYNLELNGVSTSSSRHRELTQQYESEAKLAEQTCVEVARRYMIRCPDCKGKGKEIDRKGNITLLPCSGCEGKPFVPYRLQMPQGGVNNSLREFAFNRLKLPVMAVSKKTGAPSLDKNVLDDLAASALDEERMKFCRALRHNRRRHTALSYLESYQKFWLGQEDTRWLYPSVNQTGTDTLRLSCNRPNAQQVSKQEATCYFCLGEGCSSCEGKGTDPHSLRYLFGPAPGREWWKMDAENIELRIPAYKAGEQEMIDLFERPKDPPYFGSNHLLISHVLHPEKFEECRSEVGLDGRVFKKKYADTWYQWVKNGNFAVTYGAVKESGTADRAYHVAGAQERIERRFVNLKRLSQATIDFAERHGYVETFPDKTVDPVRGYPLMCMRTEWGSVRPTVPFNYKIQGTAMQWTRKAMVRCEELLDAWRGDGFAVWMTLTVHDELVFDLPVSRTAPDRRRPRQSNLWRALYLKHLMEQGGDDIGVPTPVSLEYCPNNWGKSVKY
jgi:DNA polymerase I-like protein with 3'-5' exonuclease and polymerase domains